jgi:NAD(P)-dependent dehydrogenase (short-subunit alcohol dehydrogenase family)
MKPCPERLRDKVALVTGGARGIGRAICERFAAEGARVAVADLDATECARVAGEIGEGTFGVRLDVTNQGSVDAAVGAVVEQFGRIDVLINNAGVWELQPLLEMTRERTARVFAVNVEGLIFTTQAVARQMITQGQGGRVINFSSQAGRRGEALSLAYCAA